MKYWVWLTQISYIGPVTANRLLQHFGNPKIIYEATEAELISSMILTKNQIERIHDSKTLDDAKRVIENCEKNEISILNIEDSRYPDRAKNIKDAPVIFYYKGTVQNLQKTVGIVGARRCTQEMKQKAIQIAEEYTYKGNAVISGMAKGIDSYAHTACIKAGGCTVAILGNGLDICYPSEHKKLMESIEETGLLLSEYPPGTKPAKYTFPRRNRLISAWSDKLVVLAPGKGSGALITAEYEKQYGREVTVLS